MATVSDIDNTVLSGLNHIDSLLGSGPDWNLLTPAGNTILYTFNVTSNNETGNSDLRTAVSAFSAAQQIQARAAFAYLSALTGITFTETTSGATAKVHLADVDIASANTTGLCSWHTSYSFDGSNNITNYSANAYVYLDNAEWNAQNSNLTPGGDGYETLLHELGHMLGLKHPFDDSINLPAGQDNTSNTLMSYTSSGGPYSTYRQFDLAALAWIYGGDGLGGALGNTSAARYIMGTNGTDTLTGTTGDDTLEGDAGNDVLNGGTGNDTAVYNGNRASYTITTPVVGTTQIVSANEGTDTVTNVERFRFADGTFTLSQLQNADTTPPAAPTANVSKNAAGYVTGNTPHIVGLAEASATVTLYSGTSVVGTGTADSKGFFDIATTALADNSYSITAKATDAAGNVSAASNAVSFQVDAHPPATPTITVSKDANGLVSGNQPVLSGTADAGSVVELMNGAAVIGTLTTTGPTWSLTPVPLPNGSYNIKISSTDAADNETMAPNTLSFTVNSALNQAGTANGDTLTVASGNHAIDGGAGTDTALFANVRASYTVTKSGIGFTVAGSGDTDSLVNVERVHFSDANIALDIDGIGGKAYRVYQAAFDRVPDLGGVGFWISRMDAGVTLNDVAGGFMASAEFTALYGANLSTSALVNQLYQNVLHRPGEAAGIAFWINAIDVAHVARAEVLASFSESAENQAQVIGTIQNGFAYTPFG